jgi:hypothetical protein
MSHMTMESVCECVCVSVCVCVCACACVRVCVVERDVVTETSHGCMFVPGVGSGTEE